MKKLLLSFGIIFKNEIRCLERCLKSIQPLKEALPGQVEIVMADTGSDDGSREVAEKYADILFDFPWIDDFAAARNAVMDRCSGVWYFSIDADEWFTEDVSELVAFSREKNLPRDFGGVVIRNYKSAGLEKDQNYVDFLGIRMVRMSTGVRYHGCIHEGWESPDGGILKTMSLQDTMLYHDGYVYENKAAEQEKRNRNMPLLRKKLAENPDDIQTVVECVDSTKHHDSVSIEYARRAVELVNEKKPLWDKLGAVVFRNAVSVAQLQHLPDQELEKWAEEGLERFPDSMFTRVDLAYYTFVHYFDKKEYTEAARWGEIYQHGVADYRAGQFTSSEFSRGVLEFISPFWERKISVLMPQVYLELDEPEKALAGIRAVRGSELEDAQQVELCVNMLMRIHRTTWLDVASVMNAFWKQINEPFPDERKSKMRRGEFLSTASNTFTKKYRTEESEKEGSLRHSFGVFSELDCGLGTAAAMLETRDTQKLEQTMAAIENWNEIPIFALAHALECGVTFPLPGKPLKVEEMDSFATRLAKDQEFFFLLVDRVTSSDFTQNWQTMLWARGLVIVAVQVFGWNADEVDVQRGLTIAKQFSEVENIYLSNCYAAEVFTSEHICALPSMHRFGWYCAQAFCAVKNGDVLGYVRLLRAGLGVCPNMKPMVEFLVESSREVQQALAPAELKQLAEQVRLIIARFSPKDPMLAQLKASEAYQKVAYLIED